MKDTYLLVGLGNPGARYEHTRHNLGFMIVDNLAQQLRSTFRLERNSYVAQSEVAGKALILAKPLTYMNRSGVAVRDLVQRHDIPLINLLIILDDLNLPLGTLRFRRKGSDGGHNGLASVIYHLNSEAFPRLRVGIGNGIEGDTVSFVLSEFNKSQKRQLPEIIERASEACLHFVSEGIDKSMSKYN